jgi:septum formation protein
MEAILPDENPEDMVRRLALAKAQAVAKLHPRAFILGADTTVVVDGAILGKPNDELDAQRMLSTIKALHTKCGVVLLLSVIIPVWRLWNRTALK